MATRQQAAREFVKTWGEKEGKEDAERQTFWNDLLNRVYGINDYYNFITYEKDVKVKDNGKVTTRRIDGYIPSTKTMIEMKGKHVTDLSKPLVQSGGAELTPFEQAKRYANFMPNSEQPRWILVSNFSEIDIHDMEHPLDAPKIIKLEDLPQKVKSLEFIVNQHEKRVVDEQKISVDAGNIVAKIYDELVVAYSKGRDVDVKSHKIQRSLNMLIVRLVFLLYADDSNLFGKENIFQEFIERREPRDIRRDLAELFKVLDQKEEDRDPYLDKEFNQFSYVNGGMFADESVIIPQFTDELKRLIVEDAGQKFDWSSISPTIFGAVFESTLNPESRRAGGMHYTSIENIHKVIDPLFLDDLHEEFDKIQNMGNRKQRIDRAIEFREKLGKLKLLDPACGSGNFLTETYLSLRKMENECLKIIVGDQSTLALNDSTTKVQVKIQNFYGIEVNDFAVSVARTAMWIAESQMWEDTKDITFANANFLPLDSNDSIFEGNALRMKWQDIVKPYELNYVMGNPPFVGAMYSSPEQREDIKQVFGKDVKKPGEIDYVAGWYKMAADYIQGTTIKCAFVSTNSISQGQQVALIWPNLIKEGLTINFAYRTFVWDNEANNKAHVHCVIIGFSNQDTIKNKYIFDGNEVEEVKHINPYLKDGDNYFVYSRTKPLCDVPQIRFGSMPRDGGNFIISEDEKDKIIHKEPKIAPYIKPYLGASEFLHNKKRYCLWLRGANPAIIAKSSFIKDRVEKVREFRAGSKAAGTRKFAETPTIFAQIAQPDSDYIAVPKTSSQRRKYIPMGFLNKDIIASDLLFLIPNADLYSFGVLSSIVHNAWMRTVAGRLKSDYRYSKNVVYNNFIWPVVDEKQKEAISKTARGILNARKLYAGSSLADLYDPLSMPAELVKAHKANDRAVLKAYNLPSSTSEQEITDRLFKLYSDKLKENE